ncbi:MAG: hypothetical protein U5R14_06575 [Gemmatimonadota bacterium]|nr:hypothetical protein [Gemmatimonadota bacterium]
MDSDSATARLAGFGTILVALHWSADADDASGDRGSAPESKAAAPQTSNPPYDGRLAFTRVRYRGVRGGFGRAAWAHDYPAADHNMQAMLDEFTAVRAHRVGSNVLHLEDR